MKLALLISFNCNDTVKRVNTGISGFNRFVDACIFYITIKLKSICKLNRTLKNQINASNIAMMDKALLKLTRKNRYYLPLMILFILIWLCYHLCVHMYNYIYLYRYIHVQKNTKIIEFRVRIIYKILLHVIYKPY